MACFKQKDAESVPQIGDVMVVFIMYPPGNESKSHLGCSRKTIDSKSAFAGF